MQLLIIFAELGALFFLSRWVTQSIFGLLYFVLRSRMWGVTLVTLLLFPGTVLHELAHLFTASILGVRTGKFSVVPESIEGEEIRTGHVMIAQTDPFRRYAIGLAPIFVGILALTALAYLLPTIWAQFIQNPSFSNPYSYFIILNSYFLFAISNAMFSSPEDLKGFVPFVITLGILAGAAFLAGLRFSLAGPALEIANRITATLQQTLLIVLAVNGALLLISAIGTAIVGNITHRRLIKS